MKLQEFINTAKELAQIIIDSGLYEENTGTYKDAIKLIEDSTPIDEFIEKHHADTDRVALIWSNDDVIHKALEMDVGLNEAEAVKILHDIKRHHDASIGVNWDVISFHIDEHLIKQTS